MRINSILTPGCFALVVAFGVQTIVRAHSPDGKKGEVAAKEMAESANRFLASLSGEQRAQAVFEVKADERENWHFIPRARKGLSFKEMSPSQSQLAHALLATGMSQRGYVKALTIMSLEGILKEIEGAQPLANRDSLLYFVSIFGQPGDRGAWGWRVEGHHLAINFTIAGGNHIAATPSFFGSNPATVATGARTGLKTLAEEEELGRALFETLTKEQRAQALISEAAPKDIITGADRRAKPLEPGGVAYAKLKPDQREALMLLIREYVQRHRPEVAESDMEKIRKAGFEKIHFAWAGSLKVGEGHYYRVQGPTFLMEYDNVQNNANHVHSVWRDFESDFGADLLREHYEKEHTK